MKKSGLSVVPAKAPAAPPLKLSADNVNIINCLAHNKLIWQQRTEEVQRGFTEASAALQSYVETQAEQMGVSPVTHRFDLTSMSFIALIPEDAPTP